EIIVIDQSREHDAKTSSFLKDLIDRNQIIYIYQAQPNAQRARNTAIAESTGEVLLFVDDDVEMGSDFVGAHWRNYMDPEIAAVCGFYLEPGEVPLDELPDDCSHPLTGWIYTPHCYNKRVDSYLLSTCNGSLRREIAIKLGGFDENFTHTLLDDTDFSCRMKKLGVKSVHDPEAKLIHLKEPSGGKRPGGVNTFVIADSNKWYTWCYFFWSNFGWRSRHELLGRLRTCVFRRVNIYRPWYMVLALVYCVQGGWRAARAIRDGRKLGLPSIEQTAGSIIKREQVTN